jgi:hypothetical protein
MKLKPIAANQTELEINPDLTVFFSYKTPVAACINGKFVRTACRWSVTTSKHINKWLNGATAETVEQSVLDSLAA